jgi:hypothetical protein
MMNGLLDDWMISAYVEGWCCEVFFLRLFFISKRMRYCTLSEKKGSFLLLCVLLFLFQRIFVFSVFSFEVPIVFLGD